MNGKDMVVKSRTGSGKTIAFALPVVEQLLAVSISDDTSPCLCIFKETFCIERVVYLVNAFLHKLIESCFLKKLSAETLGTKHKKLMRLRSLLIAKDIKATC